MGPAQEKGSCAHAGGESAAVVYRGACRPAWSSCAHDDERGSVSSWRKAVQGRYNCDQAVRYNMVLDVLYMIITNGRKTCICRRVVDGGARRYVFVDTIPAYAAMLEELASEEACRNPE